MFESPEKLTKHLKRIKKLISDCKINRHDSIVSQEEKQSIAERLAKVAEEQIRIIETERFDNPKHAENILIFLRRFEEIIKNQLLNESSKIHILSSGKYSSTKIKIFNSEFNGLIERLCEDIEIEIHRLKGLDIHTKIDLEYLRMNKIIKFGIAALRINGAALYIGSSPYLMNVLHISELVRSKRYILSDLEFPETKKYQFKNCIVEVTNKNGLKLNPKQISFIMIDQAVTGFTPKYISELVRGTLIYFHSTKEIKDDFTQYNLIKIGRNLYKKQ